MGALAGLFVQEGCNAANHAFGGALCSRNHDGNVDDNAGLLLNHDCAPVGDGQCQNNLGAGVGGDHPLLRDIVDGTGNVILSGPAPLRAPPASFSLPVLTHNIFDNDFGRIFRTITRPREMQFAQIGRAHV